MGSAVNLISNANSKPASPPAPAAQGEQDESFGKVFANEMGEDKAEPVKGKQQGNSDEAGDDTGQQAAHAWLAELQLTSAAQMIKLPQSGEETDAADPVAAMKAWLANATGKVGAATKEDATSSAQLAQAAVKDGKAELAADGKALPLLARQEHEDLPLETDAETTPTFRVANSEMVSQPVAPKNEAQAVKSSHYVPEPVGSNRWGDAVAQRVALMLGKQEQQIEMQLNPPHLGPMEVRLSLAADNASVVFASQHAGVREALAAATPRLSALLADQGIQLVNVQVASDSLNQQTQQQASAQQQQGGQQSGGGFASAQGEQTGQVIDAEQLASAVHLPVARSGLSLYA